MINNSENYGSKPKKNIVLCGFMGCGKSTVGYRLSKKLSYQFYDTDNFVEHKMGMSVSEIFETYGEGRFRDEEHLACAELSAKSSLVIATGGGAVTFSRNVEALKKSGVIVFIDVPLDVILERLHDSRSSRPLISGDDGDRRAAELYEKRISIYRLASDVVVNGAKAPIDVVREIIKAVEN